MTNCSEWMNWLGFAWMLTATILSSEDRENECKLPPGPPLHGAHTDPYLKYKVDKLIDIVLCVIPLFGSLEEEIGHVSCWN